MKWMSRLAVAAVVGLLAFAPMGEATAPQPEAGPVPVAKAAPAPVDFAALMAEVENSAEVTCDDFGMWAADKRDECNKSCKKNKKCVMKEMCGDYRCPEPGYCWKCST
jgi:hypothetical protein